NALRCQRFPGIYDGYEAISADELGKALQENEQRLQGRCSHVSESGSVAHKFLKTVEITSGAVRKTSGYQTRFGQPALFITLTPNTGNSLVMAHYAGITSVDNLFDILNATAPSKTELR
ncbi:hypothetical protein JG688_00014801, partial [Phytophthora aleatoria]